MKITPQRLFLFFLFLQASSADLFHNFELFLQSEGDDEQPHKNLAGKKPNSGFVMPQESDKKEVFLQENREKNDPLQKLNPTKRFVIMDNFVPINTFSEVSEVSAKSEDKGQNTLFILLGFFSNQEIVYYQAQQEVNNSLQLIKTLGSLLKKKQRLV